MKINKSLLFLIVLFFVSGCVMLSGFTFFHKEKSQKVLVQNYSETKSDVWCITFQLVWNDFINTLIDGKPVQFVGGNPPIADELNKQLYSKNDISENSYYIKSGKISKNLRKEIEKNIYKKFKEKSDVLSLIDWNAKNSYLFYAILKKDFNFFTPFDKLNSDVFNGSKDKVKFFGIQKKSDKALYRNVSVLFYNSDDEYAVKLLTKENEEVILFRTLKDDTFENYYSYILNNSTYSEFTSKDVLIIPEINVDKTISYDSLCGKKIIGTEYLISQALQTIKFKLDNKGGSLKSEAVMSVMKTSLLPQHSYPRFFLFNKPFVLFLKEAGKDKPYFALKIENTDFLIKE